MRQHPAQQTAHRTPEQHAMAVSSCPNFVVILAQFWSPFPSRSAPNCTEPTEATALATSGTSVLMSGFIRYLNAPPTRRSSTAREAVGGDYRFATDYYALMRQAVSRDRATSRDGSEVITLATNASARKRNRYEALAASWCTVQRRWNDYSPTTLPTALPVALGGLKIPVKAAFAEVPPDGTTEVVYVRYALEEIAEPVADGILRLLQLAYPGTAPVLVDLSHEVVRTSEGRKLARYDSWLEAEAAGLAHLLLNAA